MTVDIDHHTVTRTVTRTVTLTGDLTELTCDNPVRGTFAFYAETVTEQLVTEEGGLETNYIITVTGPAKNGRNTGRVVYGGRYNPVPATEAPKQLTEHLYGPERLKWIGQ